MLIRKEKKSVECKWAHVLHLSAGINPMPLLIIGKQAHGRPKQAKGQFTLYTQLLPKTVACNLLTISVVLMCKSSTQLTYDSLHVVVSRLHATIL
jgi:hypothetical protein